ncbi:hypothetical protein yaldo0001_25800 [Yersinia aldovae ATCC 35236]|nr:hypothetical protein yaldo0001_25800 [Yersinia aldovae ATCC 35236]
MTKYKALINLFSVPQRKNNSLYGLSNGANCTRNNNPEGSKQ